MPRGTPRVLASASVCGVALLGLIGCGGSPGGDRRGSAGHPAAVPAERWSPLPALPSRRPIDLDGADIATADGALFVSVVGRGDPGAPSRVSVFREAGGRWLPEDRGERLLVDRDQRVDLLGGNRPCVAASYAGRVHVRCLVRGRWRSVGPPAFRVSEGASFGGAYRAPDGIVLLRVARVSTALAPGSRLRTTAYRRLRNRWVADAPGEIAPTVPGGAQRPFGFVAAGRRCAAYDALPADRRTSPSVTVSCSSAGRWRPNGPPLDPTAGARLPNVAFGVEGAAAIGDTIYVGVDRFVGGAVDWTVHALRDGRWRPTSMGGADPEWNEQGSLFTIGGELWAIRFDQRPNEGSLATRVLVLRRDRRSGRTAQIGAPLRQSDRLSVPLYYGLAELDGAIYAMATLANPRTRRDEVRVFLLTGLNADAASPTGAGPSARAASATAARAGR